VAQGVIVDEMGASLDELEAIYRSSLPRFRRVAAAIVGDRERACDVVQDAFGTAIRKRRSFRGSGPLEAWVWRLVVNEARDQVRPFELPLEELPARPEARTNGGGANAREELRVAVALLPERQRLVLFLRYYADLDYAAIADALEIATGTVAAALNAAHATLRRTLQEVSR
jgi:RNA polymerase sigma-70 factor, ECF subfamily